MTAVKELCDRLVRQRQELLTAPENRARFTGYLDELEARTDPLADPATAAYIRQMRDLLADHAEEAR